ncbi:MAG: lysophospholipid acyltransferase family protein [Verrucomicrobiota bacterium]
MGLVYQCGYYLSRLIANCCFDYRVIGRERIPKEGGLILAMNHQSFLDPPLAGIACDREIFYLARKSLLKWPILGPLFPKLNVVPVDEGGGDMSALKTVIRVVKSGNGTVIFPEGTRSRDGKLLPAQSGLGLIVSKTKAPVVPMRIFGAYEAFPANAKSVTLAKITIVVGEVMRFTDEDFRGDPKDVYRRISEAVMKEITALQLPKE